MATLEEIALRRQRKAQRERKVCNDFMDFRARHPEASPTCIMDTLAARYRKDDPLMPTTSVGVRGILKRNGVYPPQNAPRP